MNKDKVFNNTRGKQKFFRAFMLIGLVLIVMTAYLGTTNLQALKLEQIETEIQLLQAKGNIASLVEDREEIEKNGNNSASLRHVNQELVNERIKLEGAVKKWYYIAGRTASYIQGGIVLLLIGIIIVVYAMTQWYKLVRE